MTQKVNHFTLQWSAILTMSIVNSKCPHSTQNFGNTHDLQQLTIRTISFHGFDKGLSLNQQTRALNPWD
jgi:hypothetical protein